MKKEFAFIYKNEVILRGIATDRNYKKILNALSRELYHPFKVIEKLDELQKLSVLRRTFVKIFRVQGGELPNSSRERIIIEKGKAKIIGHERLYVTFIDDKRVLEFWILRGEKAEVFTAEVNNVFFDKLLKDAVKQEYGKAFPNRPQFGDATKTKYSLGIPNNYFEDLIKNMKNPQILKFD